MSFETAAASPPSKALPPLPPQPLPERKESLQYTPSLSSDESRRHSLRRKPVPNSAHHNSIPSFNFAEHDDAVAGAYHSRQSSASLPITSAEHSRTASRETVDGRNRDSANSIAVTKVIPMHQLRISNASYNSRYSHAAEIDMASVQDENFPQTFYNGHPPQQQQSGPPSEMVLSPGSESSRSTFSDPRYAYQNGQEVPLQVPRTSHARPSSAYTLGSELHPGRRTHSPRLSVSGGSPASGGSPVSYGRNLSAARRSPDARPVSYVDLLNLPYNQQVAPTANLGNTQLRHAVGQNASLMDSKKTLDMYRQNVKKTQDNVVQYEFAIYMVTIAREVMAAPPGTDTQGLDAAGILREARSILQKLADRSYPFAQYYLADGYASGLFNKDKPDYDRAFPLFVAASKHGHAESGYRTGLCYEFGWGCRKDYAKAVQFYRAAASKNHPGAATRLGKACLVGDMGLQDRYKEGVKWLKRATESADFQYNSAPYELGLLHESGFGQDIFKDEVYAVQLFTQAAELGHAEAALRLGEAYEHGYLQCPKDAALSVHYYNCAAQAEIPEAMMNLCAWYMVGAPPVLEKDENEAYEWAKRAAEHGLPKAEYAVGYFTEMGIGCRRDPLEANVWYVRAADHGDDRAKQRLAIIQAAASGQPISSVTFNKEKLKKGGKEGKEAKDENCVVM